MKLRAEQNTQHRKEELDKEPKIKMSLTVQHVSFSDQSENTKIREARPWDEW